MLDSSFHLLEMHSTGKSGEIPWDTRILEQCSSQNSNQEIFQGVQPSPLAGTLPLWGSYAFGIMKWSNNEDAAVTYIKYLLRPECARTVRARRRVHSLTT